MSADFPKISFEIALEPTKAFPLDARVYCDSYEDALSKAEKAGEIGSNTAQYYYGQTLEVVETISGEGEELKTRSSLYQIQPGGSLKKLVSSVAFQEEDVQVKDIEIDALHFFGYVDQLTVNLPTNARLGDMIYFSFYAKENSSININGSYIGYDISADFISGSFNEFIGLWNGQVWAFVVNNIVMETGSQ